MSDLDRAAARERAGRYGNTLAREALDALDAAEATIARVRALAEEFLRCPIPEGYISFEVGVVAIATTFLTALDGPTP